VKHNTHNKQQQKMPKMTTSDDPQEDPPNHHSHPSLRSHHPHCRRPAVTAATYRFVLCAALNSCNLGYDIGVSTDAGRLMQADLGLTNPQREVLIGSINFWAST
jgi:predicted nuclease of restriction endonuclease-like RecB superfamily